MSNTEDSRSDIHTSGVTQNSIEVASLELRRMDPGELNPSRLYNDDPSRGSKHLRESIESLGVKTPIRARIENDEIKYIDGGRRVDGAEQAGEKVPVWLPRDGQWSDEKVLLSRLLANTGALSEETDWLRRAWLLQDWWDTVGNSQIPGLKEVSNELGISRSTASRWTEPLKKHWNNTIVDREVFDEEQVFQPENSNNNLIEGLSINEITEGIKPLLLQDINTIVKESAHRGSDSRLRAKLLNAYVMESNNNSGISYDELKQLKKRVDSEQIPALKALEDLRGEEYTSVETTLDGKIGQKVTLLADETGKDENEIIAESVQEQVSTEDVKFPQEGSELEYVGQSDYLQNHVERPLPEPDLRMVSNKQMTHLPADTVGLTVTSPPYNVAWEYNEETTDNLPYTEYLEELIQKTFAEMYRLTVSGGYCCIVVPLIIDVDSKEMETPEGTPIAADIIDVLTAEGWSLFDQVIWDKRFNEAGLREQEFPDPESKLNNFAETIIVLQKPGERNVSHERKEQSKIIQRDTAQDRDLRDNIWHISPAQWEPQYTDEYDTAQFPEELAKRCILHYSYVGDTVLDPFCGRGTTLKMAKQLYRESVGYEIQEELERDIREYVGMD